MAGRVERDHREAAREEGERRARRAGSRAPASRERAARSAARPRPSATPAARCRRVGSGTARRWRARPLPTRGGGGAAGSGRAARRTSRPRPARRDRGGSARPCRGEAQRPTARLPGCAFVCTNDRAIFRDSPKRRPWCPPRVEVDAGSAARVAAATKSGGQACVHDEALEGRARSALGACGIADAAQKVIPDGDGEELVRDLLDVDVLPELLFLDGDARRHRRARRASRAATRGSDPSRGQGDRRARRPPARRCSHRAGSRPSTRRASSRRAREDELHHAAS